MKNHLILFVLFFSAFGVLAQTHHAVYSFRFVTDEPLNTGTQLIYPNDLAKHNPIHLFFDNNHSYYTSENKLNNLTDHSDIFGGTYYPMFYYPKDKLFYSNNYSNYTELVICKDDVNIAWEITEETKNIDGYNCIKAIGKLRNVYSKEEEYYSYEAWFAPELPYQYGPFNITGLPGLVIYANERNEKIFKLERIELNTTTSMDEFSLEPAREVTIYDLAKEHIEANEKFLNN